MHTHQKKQWPWHILTLVVVGLCIYSIYWSAVKIDYKWRWERLPQFILAKVEKPITSPMLARVISIQKQGAVALIEIEAMESQERKILEVDSSSVHVDIRDDINDGDVLGSITVWQKGPLLIGLWGTLWISFISALLGLVIGVVTGLCRISKNPTLYTLSSIYVEIIRGTPLLVQLFIFYFFVGTVLNIEREYAGVISLSLFVGAYIAEIIRSGIQSLDKGQTEAARSLGLTHYQTMRHVILPQAFKRVVPPLTGQLISLVKDSSLVSVISILDLTKAAKEAVASSFLSYEIWFCVAGFYFVINFLLSRFAALLEKRLNVHD